jgi:antitoxin (DNA-binding transcriptional repressor) of toxin-antitoxin stability system
MQLSIREAKARLSEAIVAMENGEQVTLTRNGRVVAAISPPPPPQETKGGFDFEKAAIVRKQLGLDKMQGKFPDNFFDADFSRDVLGLDPE